MLTDDEMLLHFKQLHLCLHQAMMHLQTLTEAMQGGDGLKGRQKAPAPKAQPGSIAASNGELDRQKYAGLNDSQFGLLELFLLYDRGELDYKAEEDLSAWEMSFMHDQVSPEKVIRYKLSPKQLDVYKKIGDKLNHEIFDAPSEPPRNYRGSTDGRREQDYGDDDIPF
jgi:hypothetical protein